MTNRSRCFLFLTIAFLCGSCGYKELPIQTVTKMPAKVPSSEIPAVYKKKEVPRYNYKGDKYRDPFVALTGGSSFASLSLSEEASVPNIGSLVLRGIFDDSKMKMALISGGGTNYILKGTRLYDNRQRLVKGISGVIRKESVLMIAPDKTTKELFLNQNRAR